MQIFISRDGQQFGPYSLEDLKSHVASGSVLAQDLAWHEGITEWKPVQTLLETVPVAAEAPAAPTPTAPAAAAAPSEAVKEKEEGWTAGFTYVDMVFVVLIGISFWILRRIKSYTPPILGNICIGVITVSALWLLVRKAIWFFKTRMKK